MRGWVDGRRQGEGGEVLPICIYNTLYKSIPIATVAHKPLPISQARLLRYRSLHGHHESVFAK